MLAKFDCELVHFHTDLSNLFRATDQACFHTLVTESHVILGPVFRAAA